MKAGSGECLNEAPNDLNGLIHFEIVFIKPGKLSKDTLHEVDENVLRFVEQGVLPGRTPDAEKFGEVFLFPLKVINA